MCTLVCTYTFLFKLVVDAILPSEDDVIQMPQFKKDMQIRRNVPAPGIKIPMSVIQNQFKKEG